MISSVFLLKFCLKRKKKLFIVTDRSSTEISSVIIEMTR